MSLQIYKINNWMLAVKNWNFNRDDGNWCMPRKGTSEHEKVTQIKLDYIKDQDKAYTDYKKFYGKEPPTRKMPELPPTPSPPPPKPLPKPPKQN